MLTIYFTQFCKKIETHCGLNEPPYVVNVVIKLSLVVIGPLDSERKVKTGKLITHTYKPVYYSLCL